MTVTALAGLRPPIPEVAPLDEGRQLVDWLRHAGVNHEVCERLDQVLDDLVRERHDLEEELDDLLDDDPFGPEYVEGQHVPVRHATVVLRHPSGALIPIDEELRGVIAGLWSRGIGTAWRYQENKAGLAAIGLSDDDAVTKFQALVPASTRWEWRPADAQTWVPAVFVPRDELADVERLVTEHPARPQITITTMADVKSAPPGVVAIVERVRRDVVELLPEGWRVLPDGRATHAVIARLVGESLLADELVGRGGGSDS